MHSGAHVFPRLVRLDSRRNSRMVHMSNQNKPTPKIKIPKTINNPAPFGSLPSNVEACRGLLSPYGACYYSSERRNSLIVKSGGHNAIDGVEVNPRFITNMKKSIAKLNSYSDPSDYGRLYAYSRSQEHFNLEEEAQCPLPTLPEFQMD